MVSPADFGLGLGRATRKACEGGGPGGDGRAERKPRRLTEGAAAGFELPVGHGADGVLGWVHSVMMFPPSCLSASGAGPLPEPQRGGPIFARQVR